MYGRTNHDLQDFVSSRFGGFCKFTLNVHSKVINSNISLGIQLCLDFLFKSQHTHDLEFLNQAKNIFVVILSSKNEVNQFRGFYDMTGHFNR